MKSTYSVLVVLASLLDHEMHLQPEAQCPAQRTSRVGSPTEYVQKSKLLCHGPGRLHATRGSFRPVPFDQVDRVVNILGNGLL